MKKVSPNSNMYSFITYTWNPVKGKCGYGCTYCYVNKWGQKRSPIHIDERELRSNLGSGNYIFVCSGCDLFHPDVPDEWIGRVVHCARQYQDNRYLLHTKNPGRLLELAHSGLSWPGAATICVTVESNRWFEEMGTASEPEARLSYLARIGDRKMVTIEPVMDFDTAEFSEQIIKCKPVQVNIGADSCGSDLVEPSKAKLNDLIAALKPYMKILLKPNLRRLLPEHELYNIGVIQTVG